MNSRVRWTLGAVGALLALAVPGTAQAAKQTVFMGTPPASQKSFQSTGSDVNAFFPSSVRIRRGDTVSFVPVGFHTADFPPAGGSPIPLLSPTGDVASGVNDAAGIPFWFNSQPLLGFDPRLLKSGFGKTYVKGALRVSSGLPLADKPKPMNVRFPRSGSFTYFCSVHPGMKGTVRVVGQGQGVPTARSNARRVAAQAAAALKTARSLAKNTKPAANTVSLGADGKGGVHFFGMLPGKLTVAAGTTVKFAMPTRSTEVHTATFGPGDPSKDPAKDPANYLAPIAKTFEGAPFIDPRGTYPSQPPGSPPAALSPALHGNGFWSSGGLDTSSASPLPASGSVTFTTAGTYKFYCLIHTFMAGTITVQ